MAQTPEEKRKFAYDHYAMVTWGDELIPVTEAATLYGYYSAEGNTEICAELQAKIAKAKKRIRENLAAEESEKND